MYFLTALHSQAIFLCNIRFEQDFTLVFIILSSTSSSLSDNSALAMAMLGHLYKSIRNLNKQAESNVLSRFAGLFHFARSPKLAHVFAKRALAAIRRLTGFAYAASLFFRSFFLVIVTSHLIREDFFEKFVNELGRYRFCPLGTFFHFDTLLNQLFMNYLTHLLGQDLDLDTN